MPSIFFGHSKLNAMQLNAPLVLYFQFSLNYLFCLISRKIRYLYEVSKFQYFLLLTIHFSCHATKCTITSVFCYSPFIHDSFKKVRQLLISFWIVLFLIPYYVVLLLWLWDNGSQNFARCLAKGIFACKPNQSSLNNLAEAMFFNSFVSGAVQISECAWSGIQFSTIFTVNL